MIAPITWLGALVPFLVPAGLGQFVFCLWMLARFLRRAGKVADST